MAKTQSLDQELWPEFSKLRAKELALKANVAAPQLLAGPLGVSDLEFDDYGSSFVIKPNWGASSRGVFVLQRRSNGEFHELIEDVVLGEQQLRDEIKRRVQQSGRGTASELIVEESLIDEGARPQEWKAYAFYGAVGIVQQMDRNSNGRWRGRLLDSEGNDLGRIRGDFIYDPDLPEPRDFERILDAARRISLEIPTGFVRVDLFQRTSGEVVFGEVSLIPGGDLFFWEGWDKALGEMWDEANTRILTQRIGLIP